MEHLNVGSPDPNTNECGSGFGSGSGAGACIVPITEEPDKDKTWLARRFISTSTSMKPQIPKVPKVLRDIEDHNKCFDPVVLAIGPYHHGKAEFKMLQDLKIACAKQFVSGSDPNILCGMVEKVATTARDYYDWSMIEPRFNDDEEFAWMMFLDGCFILYFIDCCTNGNIPSELARHQSIKPLIWRDLFLLENQLPYVVLKEFMSFKYNKGIWPEMVDKFVNFIVNPPSSEDGAESNDQRQQNQSIEVEGDVQRQPLLQQSTGDGGDDQQQPLHLLALLWTKLLVGSRVNAQTSSEDGGDEQQKLQHHRSMGDGGDDYRQWLNLLDRLWTKLVGSRVNAQTSSEDGGDQSRDVDLEILQWRSCPTINELIAVGINIKRSDTSCLNDIHFRPTLFGGELLLPQIVIDDCTREKFLNLVAYERSKDTDGFPVSSYLYFMDTLIDDADDVKNLRSKEILYSFLSTNQEVADHFNKLAVGLASDDNAYSKVLKGIDKYYKSNIRVSIGKVVYSHFRSTWSIIATIAAGITILLTFLTTLFSLLSYLKVM